MLWLTEQQNTLRECLNGEDHDALEKKPALCADRPACFVFLLILSATILTQFLEFGAAFTAFGVIFFVVGIMTFFDSALLALGNISFTIGITLLIGPQKTLNYFLRPNKRRGALCFFIGIITIFLKHAFVGFAIELVGILFLFGDVLNLIVTFLRSLPIIGPLLNHPAVAPVIDNIANVNVLPV